MRRRGGRRVSHRESKQCRNSSSCFQSYEKRVLILTLPEMENFCSFFKHSSQRIMGKTHSLEGDLSYYSSDSK